MNSRKSALRIANRLDIEDVLVNGHDTWTGRYPSVDTEIRDFNLSDDRRGRVFFPLIQSGHRVHPYWDCILAHAFRVRGYQPHILACDGCLDLCHAKTEFDDDAMCSVCTTRGESVMDQFGVERTDLSELLPEGYEIPDVELSKDVQYRGVSASKYALSSARCHLRKYRIGLDDSEERTVYRRFLRSALMCIDAAHEVFNRDSFDATLTHHPSYIYGGIFMDISEKNNVPAYGMAAGYREKNLIFGRATNDPQMPHYTVPELVEDRLKQPLTDGESEWLDDFFDRRISGRDTVTFHAQFAQETTNESYEGAVGLFTSLNWDGSLDTMDIVFDDPFEWIRATIDAYSGRGRKLIIKTHPAEAIHGTNESVYEWLHRSYDFESEAHSNITVLEPDTEISPYSLIDQIEAAIVYKSTTGLEAAYREVPVVVAGQAQYRGFRFTHDPADKSQYRDLILNPADLKMTPEMHDRCRRYAHLLFKDNHIEFDYHTIEDGDRVLRAPSHDEILSDEHLDIIVSRAISGDPISYRTPSEVDA